MRALAIMAAAGLFAATGTAHAQSRTYDLPAFTAVDISSGINARITVGEAQSVRAESPNQQDIDELILEVRDGKLVAYADWNLLGFLFEDRNVTLIISAPELHGAEASAGADIEVTGLSGDTVVAKSSSGADLHATAVAGRNFDIDVSSGADLDIEGACGTARIGVSSGATLRAAGLECAEVTIDASSGSGARVFASTRLAATASSGADIEVAGQPATVEQEASSGADIMISN